MDQRNLTEVVSQKEVALKKAEDEDKATKSQGEVLYENVASWLIDLEEEN